MKWQVALGLAGAVAAKQSKKVQSDDHTVNFLDQQHHTDGYLVWELHKDESCSDKPYSVKYVAIGECIVNADLETSYTIVSLADTQFSGYWNYVTSSFNNTECDGYSYTEHDHTYTSYITEDYAELIPKACSDSMKSVRWVESVDSVDTLSETYGPGIFSGTYYDSTECIWSKEPVLAEFRSNQCDSNDEWAPASSSYPAPVYCEDFNGYTSEYTPTLASHLVSFSSAASGEFCFVEADEESSEMFYDCDASHNSFTSAVTSHYYRWQCVNSAAYNYINNHTFSAPTFEDVSMTNGTDYLVLSEYSAYSEDEEASCSGEAMSWEYFRVGVCVPTRYGYLFVHKAEYEYEHLILNVSVYEDSLCETESNTVPFDAQNCTSLNDDYSPRYCLFSPLKDSCSTVGDIEEDDTMDVSYGVKEEFDWDKQSRDVIVFKYYATSDDCSSNEIGDITGAVVLHYSTCLNNPAFVSGTETEAPIGDKYSVIILEADDYTYTYELYTDANCSAHSFVTTVTQPKYNCPLTDKGYTYVMTYQREPNPIQPNHAVYFLLFFLCLGPIFFFAGVYICGACGYHQPPNSENENGFEMNNA